MFLRSLKDITIQKGEISVTRNLSINSKQLEAQIKQLNYNGEKKIKDITIENTKFPPFIQVFYYHFFAFFKIPTQDEFIQTYFNWLGGVKDGFVIFLDKKYDAEKLSYRILRTYPSLIRDLHFFYLLNESNRFEKVSYSMQKDYFNGLDLEIVFHGETSYISIFIDSVRGKYFKKMKTKRHDYTNINEIEFSVDFNSLSKIGNILLLNNNHIEEIIEYLNDL
jgi:hypothetical protein